MNNTTIIKQAQIYKRDGGYLETEEELLRSIWLMISLVVMSDYEYYKKTGNKYVLDTELLDIVKPYLKYDLSEEYHLGYMIKTAKEYFNCNTDEVILKSFAYLNEYDEEGEVFLVRTFEEVADLLEIIGEYIVYPEKWFSPGVYKQVGELLKTFEFDRTEYGKCVAYKQAGEFTPEQVLKVLKELNGTSLSDKYSFYPTPKDVAERVRELARIQFTDSVLEPSAGTGSLIEGVETSEPITCVEYSPLLAGILKEKGYTVFDMKFEDYNPAILFNKILMNPPFENRMDAKFIVKAFLHLNNGGLLVAIHSPSITTASDKHSKEFQKLYDEYGVHRETVESGAFENSGKGTKIATMISVFNKG